jgi:hypothetical protein
MFDELITSKTRIKLLMRFFINEHTTGYLRNLAAEFGESTNAIRSELNRFEAADLLRSQNEQNKKVYRANTNHPYYYDIHKLLLKYIGIDQLIDQVVLQVGDLEKAYVTGDFAKGNPGNLLDLVLIGNRFDHEYIHQLIRKAEENVSFRVRYIALAPHEADRYIHSEATALLVWSAEK